MNIVRSWPPIINQIATVFPGARQKGVIFAWGDIIFNPSGAPITRELRAHEEVHGRQQGTDDASIRAWWARYLTDTEFRFSQELESHRAEFRAFRGGHRGFSRAGMLHDIAERLASPLYGSMVDYQQAVELIKADTVPELRRAA